MFSWLMTISGIVGFWYFSDLSSDNIFASIIFPLGCGVCIIIAITRIGSNTSGGSGGSSGGRPYNGDSSQGWGDGGGDGGGGD